MSWITNEPCNCSTLKVLWGLVALIVFEHTDFVIIDKPVGLTMHDKTSGVIPYVSERLNMSSLHLVHRLDDGTSGCLILAKNPAAAAYFQTLFANHQIQKYYLALVNKKPSKKQGWVIGDMINRRKGQYALTKTTANPAVTQFFSTAIDNVGRIMMVKPHTGKTHQIRVAMKSLGSPILGDDRYAGNAADRMYLHAWALQFTYQEELISVSQAPTSGEQFICDNTTDWLASQSHPSELPWPSPPKWVNQLP